jgi:hypothetical protein
MKRTGPISLAALLLAGASWALTPEEKCADYRKELLERQQAYCDDYEEAAENESCVITRGLIADIMDDNGKAKCVPKGVDKKYLKNKAEKEALNDWLKGLLKKQKK